jgi:transposase
MIQADEAGRVRRWRSISEKRQIVQLTMEPGASVAEIARAHGVNANQVFKWRRALERGELSEPCSALLPIAVASVSLPATEHPVVEPRETTTAGSIHIELPGIAMISVESGADSVLVRQILESLRK